MRTTTVDQTLLYYRINSIKDAAFALDGIKHALREEADKDQPSFYLIGSCIANMRVIADCISENVHGIETMSGFAAD